MKIGIINGPNLNLLGKRQTDIYGLASLDQITELTSNKFLKSDIELEWYQSNCEGDIVSKIQNFQEQGFTGLVINPAAYGHTSIAILDALYYFEGKIVEVHLTQTFSREEFRHQKLTAKAADIIMEGLGRETYIFAIKALLK